ncbi:GNAT family N-acetyltransferase [Geothrix paludis]|uniref:GNAT family N-acetyltransferase n=1 Tax=Geothrix paludis TaxID=2922722 RepID=UPI001FAB7314|nr:GNAT family N-acetyltransferase [Geothrix paludis]
MPTIEIATTRMDIDSARDLFLEYQSLLGVDLGFQSFDEEVNRLPGDYAPPDGRLLLAKKDGFPLGCIALRRISATRCEMKRLFVRPQGRGLGVGKKLVARLIAEARSMGYAEIVLDTLPTMTEAQTMYLAFGFHDIAPYRPNPIPGARFLGLSL